jgi:hypothetical protein
LLFIDPESTSIDVDEMLLLFTGHLKCVSISDNYFITLSCSVGDVLVNESIPIKTLNKWDNPCLPDSSIGRSEPVLYGRFSNTDTWKEFYDLAPSILIDDFENRYLVSSHQLLAYPNTFYFYNSSLERYVKILSEIEFLNSGNASIRHDFVVTCEALFYLKQRGSQMSTQLVERYLDFIHNEESDSLTLNPGDELFLATDAIKDTGYPEYYYEGQGYGNLKLTISLGEVIDGLSGEAAKIKYYMNNSFYYIPGNEITRQDANTRKEILLDIPVNNYFESLKSMEYGIVVEPGAAVEFKDMHVKIKYLRK